MGLRCRIHAAALLLATGSAAAADITADMFSYGVFGTAGVARSNTDAAEYVIGDQTTGATRNFDYKTDSRLGLQGTFAPTQWLSGTVQVLAATRQSSQMTIQAQWAYLKLKPASNLSFRAGKLQLPTFLSSDSRYVGYSNTWLRAPNAVYGEAIYDTYEGGDVSYGQPIDKYTVTVSALAGAPNPASQPSGPGVADYFTGHHMYGYSLSTDLNAVTVRASVLNLAFRRYIVDAPLEQGRYHFYSLGVEYDQNNILAKGEFIELRTGDPDDNINGWYVMGGYRLGKWQPYAIYAANHKNRAADGAIPELNGSTISIGVRRDLLSAVDIKAEVVRAQTFDYGTPFINVRPGFNNRAYIFSLVVDFVFQ